MKHCTIPKCLQIRHINIIRLHQATFLMDKNTNAIISFKCLIEFANHNAVGKKRGIQDLNS